MQKMSANEESALSPGERRPYYLQSTWAIGMGLIVFGSLGDFVSLSLAAQSIVAPIKSSALVTNLAIANIYLGEELSRTDVYGCCFIVFGSLISVVFGSRDSPTLRLDDLRVKFYRIPFIIYVCVVLIWAVSCEFYARFIQKKRDLVEQFLEDLYLDDSETEALWKSLKSNPDYKEAQEDYTPYMKTHSFLYCSLAGTMGGQSLIFVKCVAELCKTTISGENQLIYPLTYVFLLCMAFFIVFQVHFLNRALIISDALFVVPVYQCFFISFSTLGGLVFYEEYASFSLLNWVFSLVGLIFILIGVRTLASRTFDDLEVQFVSTNNILHTSTLELDQPLVNTDQDDTSDTESTRRVSMSLRLQSSQTDLFHPGNVFSELPITSAPMSHEIIHASRSLHRALTPSRTPRSVNSGMSNSLDSSQWKRSTMWTVISEDYSSDEELSSTQISVDSHEPTPSRVPAQSSYAGKSRMLGKSLPPPAVNNQNEEQAIE